MKVRLFTQASVVVLALFAASSSYAAEPVEWNAEGGEKTKAMTLTPDRENGIEVYEVCSACHLLEGWGTPNGTFPQIAGQHR